MGETLVIVPCGQTKVWGKDPLVGPVEARDAYIGGPFKINRAYAECFADRWLILSAKYGFISPDFVIPDSYNITFKDPRTGPVDSETLREQVAVQQLDRYDPIIVLGGLEYQHAARAAFTTNAWRLRMPFAGLPIGKSMQATKRAIAAGIPLTTTR
ncbi:MAG TPA: hypothetical protein VHV31_05875 [Nitrolancea sp.]|nr:hypothetical protein [Nitrolancea sp.]